MNIARYERETYEMAIYKGAHTGSSVEMAYLGLGIAGEAGEVVDTIKKMVRKYDYTIDFMHEDREGYREWRERLKSEMGDLFWYFVRLYDELGFDIEEIMEANYQKLTSRKAEGTIDATNRSG